LRGTSVADNQAWLLKLAKLEPAKQRQVAMAFREKGDDIRAALALVVERPDVKGESLAVSSLHMSNQPEIYHQLVHCGSKRVLRRV